MKNKIKKILKLWFTFIGFSAIVYCASENSLAIAHEKGYKHKGATGNKAEFRFIWLNIIDNYKEVIRLITK